MQFYVLCIALLLVFHSINTAGIFVSEMLTDTSLSPSYENFLLFGRCVVGMLSLERETSCSQTHVHVCNSLHVGTSPRPFLMRSEQLK